MPLTDTAIRKAKPTDKPLKLSDAKGLYLLVNPTGSKLWRWKYRVDGKEKTMALGSYPDMSLAQARMRHEDERRVLLAGIDPMAQRIQTSMRASLLPKTPLPPWPRCGGRAGRPRALTTMWNPSCAA